jgi:hypothetical protein
MSEDGLIIVQACGEGGGEKRPEATVPGKRVCTGRSGPVVSVVHVFRAECWRFHCWRDRVCLANEET